MRPAWRWVVMAAAALVVFCAGAYAALGARLVARADAKAERDPKTGLLRGAEPRDLGPEDAECAFLLVHGFLGCGNNFGGLPERLAAQGFRVRVMLLPGHGTSPNDLAKASGEQLRAAVLDEVDRLRPRYKRLVLVGHSMGGTLCTLAAAEREVDGLVLAGGYFGVTGRWYYVLKPETWARLSAPVAPWLYKGRRLIQVNRPEAKKDIVSYKWVPSSSVRMLMGLAEQVNRPEVLAAVKCPVLFIHAYGDVAADPQAAKAALDGMGSERKTELWLNKSNHIIFWDYEREQVVEAVERWASEVFGLDNSKKAIISS